MEVEIKKELNGVNFKVILTVTDDEYKANVEAYKVEDDEFVLGVGGGRPKCR